MNGLDLFSGIGGIGRALSPWVRTVAYCERDRYAQGVLLSRMQSGDIDSAPIWNDVQTLRAELLPPIDIIFGGFPCQDISVAGRGAGLEGERSGLFFEIVRLAEEIKPSFVFLENVPAIRTRGLDRVCVELASLGYDLRWTTLSAAEVGAPHLRKRWFLLAHSNDHRRGQLFQQERELGGEKQTDTRGNGEVQSMADSPSFRLEKVGEPIGSSKENNPPGGGGWWAVEPDVGRVAHGIPFRVDRLKCLGNSVVPTQAQEAFMRLAGIGG